MFRQDVLADRTVVVTGGASGIGLAVTKAFRAVGAEVIMISRNEDRLQTAAAATGATYKVADVRDADRLAKIAKEIGACHVLVNAAAGNFPVPFDAMSPNAWTSVIDIVLHGTANACRAFRPTLDGSVVNIVAGYAWTGAPGVSHSGAAKAGVLNLTKSLAVEWAPIRVNAVSPGPIGGTEGMKRLGEDMGLAKTVLANVPLARMGRVEEVAEAVVFASLATYMTGHCLVVDGGQDATGPFGGLWTALQPVKDA